MTQFFKIVVYSNVFIALIAFLLSLESFVLLKSTIDWSFSIFLFFSTLFLYNLGFYKNVLFLNKAQREQALWMQKHPSYWKLSIAISAIISLLLFFQFDLKKQLIILALTIVSILYILDGLRVYNLSLNFRIPWLKALIVSIVWATLVQVPMIAEISTSNDSSQFLLIANRFFFIMAITLVFDIPDLDSDPEHFLTLARLWGTKVIKVLALSAVVISFFFLSEIISRYFFYTGIYALLAFTIFYSTKKRNELYYSGLMDGLMGLHAALSLFMA